jgi:hypothetical protein
MVNSFKFGKKPVPIVAQDVCPVVNKEHLSTEETRAEVAGIKRHVPFEIFWQLEGTKCVHDMFQNVTYMFLKTEFGKFGKDRVRTVIFRTRFE